MPKIVARFPADRFLEWPNNATPAISAYRSLFAWVRARGGCHRRAFWPGERPGCAAGFISAAPGA
eukprot:7870965-Lingulodinium_polyedra.AAC.1